ncbi:MAG TPA: 50S ribosomal protein L6, partial [Gammaproteobacteria bacterium]|nr:50S ribosomal protein L6 [Gammaproteobacteria bacterium]
MSSAAEAQATPAKSPERTSRIGRQPINLPKGVEIKFQGSQLSVKGPKGQLEMDVHPFVQVDIKEQVITLHKKAAASKARGSQSKLSRAITGTMRAKIANMIHGVSEGFEEKLLLVGVGYRAQMKGKQLGLSLGFSHPVDFDVPTGLTIETPS